MCVSVISSHALHTPYRTPEDRPGEVIYLIHDAGTVGLSVEGERKQTWRLYAVSRVRPTFIIGPADLGNDLGDVALTSETGRVKVSRW